MRDHLSSGPPVPCDLLEVLRLVADSRAYAALSPADREDAIQNARLEALTWHRRDGSFRSSQGDPLPSYQVAHRVARQAAARMRKLRARDARVVGDAPFGDDGGGSLLDAQPAREIGDPLERVLAAETGFGALRRELNGEVGAPGTRAYVRCVLNDEDLAAVAAETGAKVNTIAKANARIHARILERGAGVVPARRPRCDASPPQAASTHADAAARIAAAGPHVRAIARLLCHGELHRRDGRPDWEAIAAALQGQGHGHGSSRAVSATWREFVLSLPEEQRRHALGQVEWGLRLRDVPTP
jgi:hypothetical protein